MEKKFSQQYIRKKYKISPAHFWNLIKKLSPEVKIELNLHNKCFYFTPKQCEIIKREFGDYEQQSFMSKSELANRYKMSSNNLKSFMRDEFGEDHPAISERHLLSSKEVTMIIERMGTINE